MAGTHRREAPSGGLGRQSLTRRDTGRVAGWNYGDGWSERPLRELVPLVLLATIVMERPLPCSVTIRRSPRSLGRLLTGYNGKSYGVLWVGVALYVNHGCQCATVRYNGAKLSLRSG